MFACYAVKVNSIAWAYFLLPKIQPLVSNMFAYVCVGAKDLLVLPELNALIGVWPQHLAVEADVRDMPGVWLSADHQVS